MSREAAAMSTSQSIQGLIKWSQRGEWRDNFEVALERHVGRACRSAGIGFDELEEIIGDHWMSTLWGCVFEDLVSAGRAERNAADDYLKRRGLPMRSAKPSAKSNGSRSRPTAPKRSTGTSSAKKPTSGCSVRLPRLCRDLRPTSEDGIAKKNCHKRRKNPRTVGGEPQR